MHLTPKRRNMVAHHEAAHAVIARRLGCECPHIAMFSMDEMGMAGAVTSSASYLAGDNVQARILGLEIDAKIALAGPHSNLRLRARARDFFMGAGLDIELARAACGQISILLAGRDVSRDSLELDLTDDDAKVANEVLNRLNMETRQLDRNEQARSSNWLRRNSLTETCSSTRPIWIKIILKADREASSAPA